MRSISVIISMILVLLGARPGHAQVSPRTVTLKSFGAVCDGVTDDTSALNAALVQLRNQKGGTLIIEGICRINQQVIIPTNSGNPLSFNPLLRITGAQQGMNGNF